jgi:hypothetical protein
METSNGSGVSSIGVILRSSRVKLRKSSMLIYSIMFGVGEFFVVFVAANLIGQLNDYLSPIGGYFYTLHFGNQSKLSSFIYDFINSGMESEIFFALYVV